MFIVGVLIGGGIYLVGYYIGYYTGKIEGWNDATNYVKKLKAMEDEKG